MLEIEFVVFAGLFGTARLGCRRYFDYILYIDGNCAKRIYSVAVFVKSAYRRLRERVLRIKYVHEYSVYGNIYIIIIIPGSF